MPFGPPPVVRRFEGARKNRFLASLPRADFSLLAPHLRLVSFERGVILQEAGDEIQHVYFPHSGMVSLVTVMQSGATIETATMGRAGVVGFTAGLGARRAFSRAIVQLPAAAARLSRAQFRSAVRESTAIRELVVRYNDVLMMQIQRSAACNALHTVEERLARWLLQSHDCVDGDAIPLTQEFLGQMLGVRRASVTMIARLMQNAGTIRYHRGRIEIVDRPALEEIACGCYQVVKQSLEKVFPLQDQSV
jgi:CRP-like cAMP-binding protein